MPVGGADVPRRELSKDEILLEVLDVVERNPSVTQRSVAVELGIALGLANAYLRRCARKGWIKVREIPPRRYAYYLTPQGFSEKSRLTAQYLSHSFSFFRKARAQYSDLFALASARGHHRLVLIGTGDLADVASLVAHEQGVQIVGIHDVQNSRSVSAAMMGSADALVVTSMSNPQAIFDSAVAIFGIDRVYAPDLLRLRLSAGAPAAKRASQ